MEPVLETGPPPPPPWPSPSPLSVCVGGSGCRTIDTALTQTSGCGCFHKTPVKDRVHSGCVLRSVSSTSNARYVAGLTQRVWGCDADASSVNPPLRRTSTDPINGIVSSNIVPSALPPKAPDEMKKNWRMAGPILKSNNEKRVNPIFPSFLIVVWKTECTRE